MGNTAAAFTPERLEKSQRAVEEFLTALPAYSGVDPAHTALVVDAIRPEMYSEDSLKSAAGSFFDLMRRYLVQQAELRGFEVVDIQPYLIHQHALDGSRFEFPSDDQWNGRGHQEAARAVASSRVFRQVFPVSCLSLAPESARASRP